MALGLGGCSGAPADITTTASERLQATIVNAANQAAAGDTASALLTLETLQTQLQQSTDTGEISPDRAADIQQAIDLVRTDLQPPPAVTTTPESTPSSTPLPEVETPESTTDTTAPDTPDNPGNNGNGKGNGNGNGNGKKK
jgi:hypothetical protein